MFYSIRDVSASLMERERNSGRLLDVIEILIDCLTIIWQADSILISIVINNYQ